MSFRARSFSETGSATGQACLIADLPGRFGADLQKLPYVLRIIAENVMREPKAQEERDQALSDLQTWLVRGTSEAEIAFQPGRVLMHDTTCAPALVDIAAMRDVHRRSRRRSCARSARSAGRRIDRPLARGRPFGIAGCACASTWSASMRRNGERYRFMKWATQALSGVRVHPPGTGIMHTINLEQLATVVTTRAERRPCLGDARHADRHRQPHADDQRHRRARLGRRRARGRERHVRHAGDAAHSRRHRRASDRPAARGRAARPTSR